MNRRSVLTAMVVLAAVSSAQAQIYSASLHAGPSAYRLVATFEPAQKLEAVGTIDSIPFMDQPNYGQAPIGTIMVCKAREAFALGRVQVALQDSMGRTLEQKSAQAVLRLENSDWSGKGDCALPLGAAGNDASLDVDDVQLSINDPLTSSGYGLASIDVQVANPMGLPGASVTGIGGARVQLSGASPESVLSRLVAIVSPRELTADGSPYWGRTVRIAFAPASAQALRLYAESDEPTMVSVVGGEPKGSVAPRLLPGGRLGAEFTDAQGDKLEFAFRHGVTIRNGAIFYEGQAVGRAPEGAAPTLDAGWTLGYAYGGVIDADTGADRAFVDVFLEYSPAPRQSFCQIRGDCPGGGR